ncbi:MAG: biotin--[acetyl-CoA-carboxylase] ligase [candidate division WOR-3 bacterium]
MAKEDSIQGELLNRLAHYGRVYLLEKVKSTNDYAFTLAEQKEPAIVVAHRQTKGRGRFRRRWFADENSLIFSVLFFPKPGFTGAGLITHIAGLALCRAIEQAAGVKEPMPLLRWPNDVIIRDKKVAGVLSEQRRDAVVVGIGVNVNQTGMPENLPDAGSLYLAYGKGFDRFVLLDLFLPEFFQMVNEVYKGNVKEIWEEIKKRSSILHQRVEIRTLLRKYIGTVIDIDDEGKVVLRTDAGRLVVFNAGQVRRLR